MLIKIKNFSGKDIYTEIGKVKQLTPRMQTCDKIIYKNQNGRVKKKKLFNKKIVNTSTINPNNNKERIKKEDENWKRNNLR